MATQQLAAVATRQRAGATPAASQQDGLASERQHACLPHLHFAAGPPPALMLLRHTLLSFQAQVPGSHLYCLTTLVSHLYAILTATAASGWSSLWDMGRDIAEGRCAATGGIATWHRVAGLLKCVLAFASPSSR